jgi:hypothetical protein
VRDDLLLQQELTAAVRRCRKVLGQVQEPGTEGLIQFCFCGAEVSLCRALGGEAGAFRAEGFLDGAVERRQLFDDRTGEACKDRTASTAVWVMSLATSCPTRTTKATAARPSVRCAPIPSRQTRRVLEGSEAVSETDCTVIGVPQHET